MSKRCICEICTCGRHRCPHNPTNHLSQGDGPCQLTEYTNVYKAHPMGRRETFKPTQNPMQGGEFQDKTTQRSDYKQHPLERPFVHHPDEYVKPQGDFANQTSYKQEYVEKHGAPAQAIRNEGQRQSQAKFEGEPTYASDYKKWDGTRQKPYGMQNAWEPPRDRFEGQTTFQNDYRKNELAPRQNFKPDNGPNLSNEPFDDSTCHRADYVPHAIPAKFVREAEQYRGPVAQLDGVTTFRQDYRGQPGEPTSSYKPVGRAYQSDAPLEDITTNRRDYKTWASERPYVHAHEQYQKPSGVMESDTTHKVTYTQKPLQRIAAMRPAEARKSSAKFEGVTNYSTDYKQLRGERAQMPRQAAYMPNTARFEGDSTYKGHYTAHSVQPSQSYRPNNSHIQSDAQFDDVTQYRQDYPPKTLGVCEALLIGQPSSRYVFKELGPTGHKMYGPAIQTSVTPLNIGNSRLPSQQRLAMSMA